MLKLDAGTIFIFMLLGMDYYMFITGIIRAYFVFKRKKSVIYFLVIGGLTTTITEASVSYLWLYLPSDQEVVLGVLTCISWHLMLQLPCWLYALRIKSLMGLDYTAKKYAQCAPFILAIAQVPSAVSFMIAMFNYDLWSWFVICSAITTFVSCFVEIGMYWVLMKRVKEMFQYRQQIKQQMAMELTLSMVALIVIDIALVVVKLSATSLKPLSLPSPVPQFDNALRPFSYLLRINIAIKFFDDLIEKVNNRPTTTESYARWFNSSGSTDQKA